MRLAYNRGSPHLVRKQSATDGVRMDFAQALTALMDERRISGCELARRVYCDRSLIYRYRKGKQRPSVKLAHAIDEALDAGGLLMELARPTRRSVLAGGPARGRHGCRPGNPGTARVGSAPSAEDRPGRGELPR